jgi:hypothetical protein
LAIAGFAPASCTLTCKHPQAAFAIKQKGRLRVRLEEYSGVVIAQRLFVRLSRSGESGGDGALVELLFIAEAVESGFTTGAKPQ